jgi:hypothetical protein
MRCVVLCGLDWFGRFREANPGDEVDVVVAVDNTNIFSAALGAGATSVLVEPFSGDVLLSHSDVRERY